MSLSRYLCHFGFRSPLCSGLAWGLRAGPRFEGKFGRRHSISCVFVSFPYCSVAAVLWAFQILGFFIVGEWICIDFSSQSYPGMSSMRTAGISCWFSVESASAAHMYSLALWHFPYNPCNLGFISPIRGPRLLSFLYSFRSHPCSSNEMQTVVSQGSRKHTLPDLKASKFAVVHGKNLFLHYYPNPALYSDLINMLRFGYKI